MIFVNPKANSTTSRSTTSFASSIGHFVGSSDTIFLSHDAAVTNVCVQSQQTQTIQ